MKAFSFRVFGSKKLVNIAFDKRGGLTFARTHQNNVLAIGFEDEIIFDHEGGFVIGNHQFKLMVLGPWEKVAAVDLDTVD